MAHENRFFSEQLNVICHITSTTVDNGCATGYVVNNLHDILTRTVNSYMLSVYDAMAFPKKYFTHRHDAHHCKHTVTLIIHYSSSLITLMPIYVRIYIDLGNEFIK